VGNPSWVEDRKWELASIAERYVEFYSAYSFLKNSNRNEYISGWEIKLAI
jgi:hypothetical protein